MELAPGPIADLPPKHHDNSDEIKWSPWQLHNMIANAIYTLHPHTMRQDVRIKGLECEVRELKRVVHEIEETVKVSEATRYL